MSDRPPKQNKVEDRSIKSKRKRENKKPNFRKKDGLNKPRKIRGRIIDYKVNKGWGKIMILEGPEKFVHFQFWKKNINPSIEHHIYKNQEVSVQLDKREGHQLVTKIDYFLKERDLGTRRDSNNQNPRNRRSTANRNYSDRRPRYQNRGTKPNTSRERVIKKDHKNSKKKRNVNAGDKIKNNIEEKKLSNNQLSDSESSSKILPPSDSIESIEREKVPKSDISKPAMNKQQERVLAENKSKKEIKIEKSSEINEDHKLENREKKHLSLKEELEQDNEPPTPLEQLVNQVADEIDQNESLENKQENTQNSEDK